MADERRGMIDSVAALRNQRDTMDTGSGVKRMDPMREAHVGRGNFMTYYEDLGFSTTPGAAKSLREDEASYQKDISGYEKALVDARGKLDTANASYDKYKAEVPEYKDAVADSFSTATKDWWTVDVVKADGTVTGSYKLPTKSIQPLYVETAKYTTVDEKNKRMAIISEITPNIHPVTKEHTGTYSQAGMPEIDKALKTATDKIYLDFEKANGSKILSALAKSNTSLATMKSQIDKAEGDYSAAQTSITGSKKLREDMWENAHTEYANKLSNMEQIFSEFEVKKGGGM